MKTRGLISGNLSLGMQFAHDSPKQSTSNRHTERSEVSKTSESKSNIESMIEKRINELDSPLRQNDSYNLDSCDLDSSLQATLFAQNDGFGIDCHDLQTNLAMTIRVA